MTPCCKGTPRLAANVTPGRYHPCARKSGPKASKSPWAYHTLFSFPFQPITASGRSAGARCERMAFVFDTIDHSGSTIIRLLLMMFC